jgi:hypothetical protein
MPLHQWISARLGKGIVLAGVLVLSAALVAFVEGGWAAAPPEGKIEASIFSFDGQDFVRTRTTLVTAEGKLAVNTKLDRTSAAYKALIQKHSYVGDASIFGKNYEADYAPLIGADGKLTGALFVGVGK